MNKKDQSAFQEELVYFIDINKIKPKMLVFMEDQTHKTILLNTARHETDGFQNNTQFTVKLQFSKIFKEAPLLHIAYTVSKSFPV